MNIDEFLRQTTTRLTNIGVDSPRLSAELILAHGLNVERGELLKQRLLNPDFILDDHILQSALDLVVRREAGEPMAYLTGQKEFYGRTFYVSRATLIPRPDTELVIDLAVAEFKNMQSGIFADLGTGTGCLAITLVIELSGWTGMGVDIVPEAVLLAKNNATALKAGSAVTFCEADFTSVDFILPELDLLVSNPPYVSESEYRELSCEVRDFEPKSALVPGLSGLEHARVLEGVAARFLKSGGLFLMEIGYLQADEVLKMFSGSAWKDSRCHKDMAGQDRVIAARRA